MKTEKIKSVPFRMCIVCKQMQPKKSLLRVIKNKENEVFIDYTGKSNGRGAYVCDNPECVRTCIKKKMLNKVFHSDIPDEIYKQIEEEYEQKNR